MLMGDVAGGDIARRRWMEKDAGLKQRHISMKSKKCGYLVIFDFNLFCKNSLKDSRNQQHSDNIYCVFISIERYIILKDFSTIIHILKNDINEYLPYIYKEIDAQYSLLSVKMSLDIKRAKNKNFKGGYTGGISHQYKPYLMLF